MGKRMKTPKVNAGSMADIAFLLLIFFLVTTSIETEVGMDRMLPKVEEKPIVAPVKDHNILEVLLNGEGKLMVEGTLTELSRLREIAIEFLDNGGLSKGEAGYCTYCQGLGNPKSSDNPSKAIISLSSDRQAEYGTYVSVQNELVAAYNTLRNREAQRLYDKNYTELESDYANPNVSATEKEKLKLRIKSVQELFPLKLTELEIK